MMNRRRRRMYHHRLRNLILWTGLIITPLLLLLLWDETEILIENFQSENTATQEPLYVQDVNRPMYSMVHLLKEHKDGESLSRVYPYSVVDGGVRSVQELRSAIWRDPVVAKHYSNFKLDRARVVEAKADRDFHVSYRVGDEIFWTKKKLKVVKGEKLITDGTTSTRTRCANVLSEVPQGKTSSDEPTAEVLNTPTLPPSDPTPFTPPAVIGGGPPNPGKPAAEVPGGPTLPPSNPAPFIPPVVVAGGPTGPGEPTAEVLDTPTLPASEGTPFMLPVVIGGGSPDPAGGNPTVPGPGPGPVPVPEPATLLFLGSGLAGLWGWKKKFRK